MLACVEGRLAGQALRWSARPAVCIVAASGGYPGPYAKGKPITGLDEIPENGEVIVFHAGTKSDADGRLVTAGGRVLGVTVLDDFLSVAIERAYEMIRRIRFEGMHFRTDIGRRALERRKQR